MQLPRKRIKCSLCSLKDRKRVWAEVPEGGKPLLAIFGEAPGKDEDREGKPFIGGAGSVLNWALAANDIKRSGCFVGNIISCRPPDNDISSPEGYDAIPLCRGGFFDDLDYLASKDCKVILALGKTAMEAFKIDGLITKNRGSVYEYHHRTAQGAQYTFLVIPTYHPSYIVRKHWKRDGGGTGDNAAAWLADFAKAKEIALEGWSVEPEHFNLEPTAKEVETFVENAIARGLQVAVDTETTSLKWEKARIVVCGLADSTSHAICVPFLVQYNTPYYEAVDWQLVHSSLQRLFLHGNLLFQNALYDVPILMHHGFEFNFDAIEDTLMMHHTLTPETEHNLGFIVSVYGKTPYWKEEFISRAGSIFSMNPQDMRTYNLRDCVVLLQVAPAMRKDMEQLGLTSFYNEEVKPLMAPLIEMQTTGVAFDSTKMVAFQKRMERMTKELLQKLYVLGNLPPSFNFDSDDDLRYFLFGEVPAKFARLDKFAKSNARYAEYKERAAALLQEALELESSADVVPPKSARKALALRKKSLVAANQADRILRSKQYAAYAGLQDVRDLAKPRYVLKDFKPLETATEKSSVSAEALLSYHSALLTRRDVVKAFKQKDGTQELEEIERLVQWLEAFGLYAKYAKLLTSFTKYEPDSDGRLRASWRPYGTSTGRLSCKEPNLMQLPKRKEDDDDPSNEVREFIIASPGYSLVSCDYVNLEVYLLAFETLDPQLLAVTSEGLNIHDLNTRSLFGITPDDPHWKARRYAAKRFQFGRLQYGGGDLGVYRKVLIEAPDSRLSFKEFAAASKKWMDEHPAYVKWYDALAAEVTAKRQIKNEFGRLRIFFGNDSGIVREALSTKIQGSGASLVNRAMRRIYDAVRRENVPAKFVLQIHDQLVMETPDEYAEATKAIMVREMEKPFMYKGSPRTVMVDPSVGKTLGAL